MLYFHGLLKTQRFILIFGNRLIKSCLILGRRKSVDILFLFFNFVFILTAFITQDCVVMLIVRDFLTVSIYLFFVKYILFVNCI